MRVAGKPNKTEQAYADQVLAPRRALGEIVCWWFEGIKLRLADDTFYSPDYLVQLADGSLEIHEVKGFMQEDAAVKLKVAACQYPFRTFLCQFLKKEWSIQEI